MYLLEDVSTEDRKKILADIADKPRLVGRFSKWSEFSKLEGNLRWAVDREANSYLFRSPTFAREMKNEFHFYLDNLMYLISVEDSAAVKKRVRVSTHEYQEISSISENMKSVIGEVFGVYGLLGFGPKGTAGGYNSSFDVIPLFENEV